MILQPILTQILDAQKENLLHSNSGLTRQALSALPDLSAYALIVSGVRRCGKSTLLFQLLKDRYNDALYLNFEDPRMYEFEFNDFTRLDGAIAATGSRVLLFDEIQVQKGWELYVRQKLEEGFKVVVTGSNASLLSRELGTKLTGRHITKELFPFSYEEYLQYKNEPASPESIQSYLQIGGFPEYIKQGQDEILHHVLDDVLIRDIAVRYNIKDVRTLQRLALYLISNIGKPVSGNKLKPLFDIASTSSILEYMSHLEYAYLLNFVAKFSYSLKAQMINPRKVYAIDTGLVTVNSASFTEDSGRKFENLVYLHLRRVYSEIYYYVEKGECDFVTFKRGNIQEAVQVCYDLNQDNLQREVNGLIEALDFFKLKEGTIVTLSQSDQLEKDGFTIKVIPAHVYFLNPF